MHQRFLTRRRLLLFRASAREVPNAASISVASWPAPPNDLAAVVFRGSRAIRQSRQRGEKRSSPLFSHRGIQIEESRVMLRSASPQPVHRHFRKRRSLALARHFLDSYTIALWVVR